MDSRLIKPLKNDPGYFIYAGGFVFKSYNAKDIRLIADKDEKSGFVYVNINGKKKNLLYLLIENFLPNIKQNQQFKFSTTFENHIPLQSIRVSDFITEISDIHSHVISLYNCKSRADNANLRGLRKITPVHVAECLIFHDYKCVYCYTKLSVKNWHLDHFIPISKGGVNEFRNLVPSCNVCNIMKGALNPNDFYKKCKLIAHKCKLF